MKRIQIDLPDEKANEIQAMMESHGISTKKQLFNISLNLLKWALKEKAAGRVIASVDEEKDSYKEVILSI